MDRLNVLERHLSTRYQHSDAILEARPCSSVRTLPRFDSHVMERFIDDLCEFKSSVYEKFRSHPDLLPSTIEGLTKGSLTVAFFFPTTQS